LQKDNRTLARYLKETGQTEARLREAWAVQNQLLQYVKQQTTDEQLKAYHAANRDHFDRVEVRLSHILLRTPKGTPPTERAVAREKLQAIRADILAGKGDFATAARRFSQCPSAKGGGDLGYVLRRGMPEDEPLAKAAFAMKVGELSGVVDTEYGYHLLLVTDRKPGTPSVLSPQHDHVGCFDLLVGRRTAAHSEHCRQTDDAGSVSSSIARIDVVRADHRPGELLREKVHLVCGLRTAEHAESLRALRVERSAEPRGGAFSPGRR
jgi:hypothetical protein